MRPSAEPPAPRHRSDQPAVVFSTDPPDPRAYPAVSGDRGIGFRSTQEVRAEMSPVIYRPAGSGDDDPDRPPRVSIAGPGVPTAASFADETPQQAAPEVPDADLDEDPEIDDDDLAGEAADHLDDEVEDAPAVPTSSAHQRRTPFQRRRRRLLGWGSDPDPQPEAPAEPEPEVQPEPEAQRSPAEPPPVAPPPPTQAETDEDAVAEPADEPIDAAPTDESADAPEPAEDPVLATRRRKVRTLHIGAPPVGPPDDDPVADDLAEDAPDTADSASGAPTEGGDDVETAGEIAAAIDPRWRQAAPPRFGAPARPVAEKADEDPAPGEQASEEPAPQIDTAGTTAAPAPIAISGHVISTRGRGLSGMSVVALDTDDRVVGTTVTGRRGRYVLEVPTAGTYRLGARDTTDGDFTDSWHGGDDAAGATALEVVEDQSLADVDMTVAGRVAIDADVDVRRKKVRVEVEVIDRTTGLPGEGTVTLSTDQFSARLPLVEGRATITLFSTGEETTDTGRPDRRLRIEYPGSRHSGPATRTIRVR